ncbi:hypothetical protein [[Phormidium] sp. ETS-05]|uniref:hypothetical protein n=1 Tax=[Phormidium] sp. ETS-05 TaxID=222819 RepID=UPI0018EED6C3|nr:hypothetical protein [[Phormidium] sp. ETS-05]
MVPSKIPAEGLLMVRVAVSSSSSIKSLATVRVTCPVLLPSAMVIWAGMMLLKSVLSAVPVKAKSRVWLLKTDMLL